MASETLAGRKPVLVGDVGGTNARFALGHLGKDGKISIDHFEKLPGDDFHSFEDAIGHYISKLETEVRPDHALFALAGPVTAGHVKLTNRAGWEAYGPDIADHLDLKSAVVVNDYAAMARAMPELGAESFHVLHRGEADTNAPILVAGPGTGVGMASLVPLGKGRWRVLTGEGGHACYAPGNERESALANELRRRHGYVSRELALAGAGLDRVMEALSALDGKPPVRYSAAEVLEKAEAGDPFCREVCEMRAGGIMQMLGDAALTVGARGGVVITGGVAERLVGWLERPSAMSRFFQRGPMSSYMSDIPIRLVKEGRAPLFGAAALLFERLDSAA